MKDDLGATLRRHILVDPLRHPLLAQWIMANPYYWQDALRDLVEGELKAGRLQLVIPPAPRKRRPRGITAKRTSVSRKADGKDQAPAPAPASSKDTSPPATRNEAQRPAAASVPSEDTRPAPSSQPPAPARVEPVSAATQPAPVVQGPGSATPAANATNDNLAAGSAAESSGGNPVIETPNNTYAPEPAHTKAEPDANEHLDADPPLSREEELKEFARKALLGNSF